MKALIAAMVVLLLLLQYKLWAGDGSIAEVWRLHQAVNTQRAENAGLRERNEVLDTEVEDLKNGLGAIEEIARRELGMIGQGETFYQVVEPPGSEPTRDTASGR